MFNISKAKSFLSGSNLRNKIVLLLIILATTPILLLGGVTLFLLDLSHKEDVSRLELQLLGQKTEEIENFFADTLDVIRIVILTEGNNVDFSMDAPWQELSVQGILEENTAFEDVSIIHTDGSELARRQRSLLGNISAPRRDVSQMPWFTAVVRTGDDYISDVYYTLSGPRITIAAPMLVADRVIRVVSAEINLSQITRTIEHTFLGTSGYVALLDTNGSLITHGTHAGTQSIPQGTNLSYLERVKMILDGKVLNALGEKDRYISDLSNIAVVGAGVQVPRSGWALLVEWPLEDADAIIDVVRTQILQFTFISILAVLLLAPMFAYRLTKPISLLEEGAREIRKGNFDKRVSVSTGDELQELGEEFNKMAGGLKRLQELKDEFVFIAAHELKAPVTVTKGYISMILEGDAGPIGGELKDFLSQIDKANKALVKLVADLLQVARSEAGRIEVVVMPIDPIGIIEEILSEFKVLADEKSIKLQLATHEELPKVLADPDKLREVLTNLISNAVKYTLGSGIVIVSHERKDNMLITHVTDTGIGLSPEAQKKLFQKFYRVKAKGTEGVQGTGLGLWIIQQLIEKMKGKIWVKSEEGKGSTFSFSLPVAGVEPPSPAPVAKKKA